MSITIGIVGFGVVGLAGLKFFIERPSELRLFLGLSSDVAIRFIVWDQKPYPEEHRALLEAYQVFWIEATHCSLSAFLDQIDHALISPGVNLVQVDAVGRAKTFCELDLFAYCFEGKTIGITGSLGKTTVTKLIYQLLVRFYLMHGKAAQVALGGNVGIGMLDLLRASQPATWAVLELSSFQLEQSNKFIPDIGVWTNLYPNHLDRHIDMAGYFQAKAKLVAASQSKTLILGTQLFEPEILELTLQLIAQEQGRLVVAGASMLSAEVMVRVARPVWELWAVMDCLLTKFIIRDGVVVNKQPLIAVSKLPLCTFAQNWAIVFATLDVAGVDLDWLVYDLNANVSVYQPDDHQHRVEFVQQQNGVDFYNDSKSTVKESTLAAANQMALMYKRVHIIIGGLGKGVDRTDFTSLLESLPEVATVVAFGKEAHNLGARTCTETLKEAVQQVMMNVQPGDVVLFSPGGASFDLFRNYLHRGDCFKELVTALPID